jgi:hypothetical protein
MACSFRRNLKFGTPPNGGRIYTVAKLPLQIGAKRLKPLCAA